MIRTKNITLIAVLGLAFAACSQDSLVADQVQEQLTAVGSETIGFSSMAKPRTRATHEESAALLGGKFVVYGTKTKDSDVSPVFDNYVVEYAPNTAGTVKTNSSDWDYEGKTSKKGATQSVKYWDYSAQHFDFVAR